MEKIAVHMRICCVNVTDVDVDSRRGAATSLATSWGKVKDISKLISKAVEIANALGGDGTPSPALGAEVQGAIQKKSSSYLYEERPLDVSVCAGMAMVSILSSKPGTSGWTSTDFYAVALWSALGYQPVLEAERREKLRREVLSKAADYSATSAEIARERIEVPNPAVVKIKVGEGDELNNNVAEALAATIEALRKNAALDREELDFLWWAQIGRSRLLKRQLSAISEPTRIIAVSIEGANMLRRLPCEVHREIVLRTLDQDPELDLADLLETLGVDRAALGSEFVADKIIEAHPTVFPLLRALATGKVDSSGANVKRRVSEWGERALLEAGFIKMISQGPGKL